LSLGLVILFRRTGSRAGSTFRSLGQIRCKQEERHHHANDPNGKWADARLTTDQLKLLDHDRAATRSGLPDEMP
jgi:hypothetical protein